MHEFFVIENPPRKARKSKKKAGGRRKRVATKRRRKTKKKTRRKARRSPRKKKRTTRKRSTRRKARRAPRKKKRTTRKRRRRSNPPKARRSRRRPAKKRRRRRRSNPGRRSFGRSLKANLKKVFSIEAAVGTAQGIAGLVIALQAPGLLLKQLKLSSKYNRGWWGVGLSGVTAAALSSVVAAAGYSKAAKILLAGGLTATGIKALNQVLPPSYARKLGISGFVGGGSIAPAAAPLPALSAPLSRGAQGMGYMSPDELVALEAGHVGDYLGVDGMGDFLSASQFGQLPQSSVSSAFQPGHESF